MSRRILFAAFLLIAEHAQAQQDLAKPAATLRFKTKQTRPNLTMKSTLDSLVTIVREHKGYGLYLKVCDRSTCNTPDPSGPRNWDRCNSIAKYLHQKNVPDSLVSFSFREMEDGLVQIWIDSSMEIPRVAPAVHPTVRKQ